MYFASAEEQRWVQRGLLPEARRRPVVEELRGWNWDRPPLKPIYDRLLGVFEVAGKYCPTGRDVFLRRVEGVQVAPSAAMRDGRVLHQVVADVLTAAKRVIYAHGSGSTRLLEGLTARPRSEEAEGEPVPPDPDSIGERAQAVRAFEAHRVVERVEGVLARQPHVQGGCAGDAGAAGERGGEAGRPLRRLE